MTGRISIALGVAALGFVVLMGGGRVWGQAVTAPAPVTAPPATLAQVVADEGVRKRVLEKNLMRLDVAEKIAKACFACAARNSVQVSVHILDQFGQTIYAARMDGLTSASIETALMKAKTALYFRDSSRTWMNRSRDDAQMAIWLQQLGQFASAGGLPIIVDDQLIGSIGVGGAPGSTRDEACAHEALSVVLGPQRPLVQ